MDRRTLLKVLKKHYAQSNHIKDVFDFKIDYESIMLHLWYYGSIYKYMLLTKVLNNMQNYLFS